jgi:molybdenum cofactor cytidylyltransferase
MAHSQSIAAIVLAAGSSRRMGAGNKLLLEWDGEIAVRRAVRAAQDAGIDDVIAVVAGGDNQVANVLLGLHGTHIGIVENFDHTEGIASSIRTGVAAVARSHTGALVMLADMPLVAPRHLLPLLEAFAAAQHDAIVVPHFHGRRGNPVLWGRNHFSDLMMLTGDVGARGLLERHADRVIGVDMPDDAVLVDFDTPQDWARLRTQAS